MGTRPPHDLPEEHNRAVPLANEHDLDALLNGTADQPAADRLAASLDTAHDAVSTTISRVPTNTTDVAEPLDDGADDDSQGLLDLLAQAPDLTDDGSSCLAGPGPNSESHSHADFGGSDRTTSRNGVHDLQDVDSACESDAIAARPVATVPTLSADRSVKSRHESASDGAMAILRQIQAESSAEIDRASVSSHRAGGSRLRTAASLTVLGTIVVIAVVLFGLPGLTGDGLPVLDVMSAVISPDSSTIVVLRKRGVVESWNIHSGRLESRIEAAPQSVELCFAGDNRVLVFSRRGLFEWRPGRGGSVRSVEAPESVAASRLIPTADGTAVFLVRRKSVAVFDLSSHTIERTIEFSRILPATTAISPDQQLIVIGNRDGSVDFHSGENGRQLNHVSGEDLWGSRRQTSAVTSVAFSPDSSLLAMGLATGEIGVWDVGSMSCLGAARQTPPATHMIFDSTSSRIVTGSRGQIMVFDGQLKRGVIIPADGMDSPRRMQLATDGQTLAAFADEDRDVWLFDLQAGELRHHLDGQ